jgi:DNA-cytosine methyltransferase
MRWGTLFAGIGGVEFGIAATGHRTVWAVENDATAAKYHRLNHPDTTLYEMGVEDVDVMELPNIDALWASPPCQGHSDARRKDLPEHEGVWVGRDILRYVSNLMPRVVMIENVPKYAKHAICKEIEVGLFDMGYAVQKRIMDCSDYGIPQTRERLIIQARLDGQISWPAKVARRVGWYEAIKDILPPPEKPLAPWQAKRWDEAYNNLGMVLCDGQFAYGTNAQGEKSQRLLAPAEPSVTITASPSGGKDRCVVYPVIIDNQLRQGEENGMKLFPVDSPVSTIMASVGSNKDVVYPILMDNMYRHDDSMRLYGPHKPSGTVVASDGGGKEVIFPATQPMRARLNAACNARLQTFPDSVILPGVFSKDIRLIGNAVPCELARLLAVCAEAGANVWQTSLFGLEAA